MIRALLIPGLLASLLACDDGQESRCESKRCSYPEPDGGADAHVGPDANTTSMSFNLPAGAFKEPELTLPAGGVLKVSFSSSATALEWQVHTHFDDGTEVLVSGLDQAHTFEVTAAEAGAHYLLLKNPAGGESTTVDVILDLGPGGQLVTW